MRDRRTVHPHDRLSPREEEILGLIADGLTNREIAARLFLTPETTRNYVHSIYIKLGVTNRVLAAIHPQAVRHRKRAA